MREKSLKTPLYLTIFIAITCATLITALSITINFYFDYKKNIYKNANSLAKKFGDDLQKIISFGLTINDIPNFKDDLFRKMKEEDYLSYIVITDKDGIVLASNDDELLNKKFVYKNNEQVDFKGLFSTNIKNEIVDPESKEIKYLINVGIINSYFNNKLYSSFLLMFIISTIVILIVFFIFRKMIEDRLLKPLVNLKTATTKIANGDLTVNVSSDYRDEIGLVAENFSVMVNEIREIISKIKESIDKLKKVGDITENISITVKDGSFKQKERLAVVQKVYLEIEERVKSLKLKINSLNDFLELTTSTFLELSASSEEISRLMDELLGIVVKIEDAYKNLKNINSNLNEGAIILDKEVENILSFVSQMDASIKITLNHVKDTSKMAEKINKLAEESRLATKSSIESINKMADITNETKNAFNLLRNNINKITTMLDVINEVAEQTNMLALNAAIIATQSSEGGRAFSIVADEIKNLSRRTQKSTLEISNLISEITEQTENVYVKVQESVDEGTIVVERAKDIELKVSEIIELVKKLSVSMNEVMKAANEQSDGSGVLRKGVEDLKNISRTLITVKDEAVKIGKSINELFDFIVNVTNRVSNSIREQNSSISNVKESFVELGTFSKDLVEHIEKEEKELKNSGEILTEVYKLSEENTVKTKDLEEKLTDLHKQVSLFSEILKKFTL